MLCPICGDQRGVQGMQVEPQCCSILKHTVLGTSEIECCCAEHVLRRFLSGSLPNSETLSYFGSCASRCAKSETGRKLQLATASTNSCICLKPRGAGPQAFNAAIKISVRQPCHLAWVVIITRFSQLEHCAHMLPTRSPNDWNS